MKEHLLMWLMAGGGAVLLGALCFALKKFGPALIDKFLGGAIRQVMDIDEGSPELNQARRNMVLAQMVYLELRIPDRGKGEERKARILATLGPKAGPLVDEMLSQVDDGLKKLTTPKP